MKHCLIALVLSIIFWALQPPALWAAEPPGGIWPERPDVVFTVNMSPDEMRAAVARMNAQSPGDDDEYESHGPLREPQEGEISVLTLEDLARIGTDDTCAAGHRWSLDASYILMSDIDASETGECVDGWLPIGWPFDEGGSWDEDLRFSGTFDGNGFAVADLTSDRPDRPYQGLFGRTTADAQIRNLILTDAHIAGSQYVGALAGYNGGVVENVRVAASVSGTGAATGGLIGYNLGAVLTSQVTGQVTGGTLCGGLIGYSMMGMISGCLSTAAVTATGDRVGGLIGHSSRSSVENCHAGGEVFTESRASGGLIGQFDRGGLIANSYATGSVAGHRQVGGLVGLMTNSHGDHLKICCSYSAGYVSGSFDTGGLVGRQEAGHDGDLVRNEVESSHWDMEASGQSSSEGGTAQTTESMMRQATFHSWDFDLVWSILEGESYPYLIAPASAGP